MLPVDSEYSSQPANLEPPPGRSDATTKLRDRAKVHVKPVTGPLLTVMLLWGGYGKPWESTTVPSASPTPH